MSRAPVRAGPASRVPAPGSGLLLLLGASATAGFGLLGESALPPPGWAAAPALAGLALLAAQDLRSLQVSQPLVAAVLLLAAASTWWSGGLSGLIATVAVAALVGCGMAALAASLGRVRGRTMQGSADPWLAATPMLLLGSRIGGEALFLSLLAAVFATAWSAHRVASLAAVSTAPLLGHAAGPAFAELWLAGSLLVLALPSARSTVRIPFAPCIAIGILLAWPLTLPPAVELACSRSLYGWSLAAGCEPATSATERGAAAPGRSRLVPPSEPGP